MNYIEEEVELTKKIIQIDILLDFQTEHDIQIIRGSDYNYECYIDGMCYSVSLTPIGSMALAYEKYMERN